MTLSDTTLLPGLAVEIGTLLLLKGSLVLSLAWVLARAVRSGSAATRYAVWIAALAGLLALPVLPVAVPGANLAWVTSPVSIPESPQAVTSHAPRLGSVSPATTRMDPGDAREGVSWRRFATAAGLAGALLLTWLAGVLVLLARFTVDWIRVSVVTARAARTGGLRRDVIRRAVVLARRQGVQRRIRVLLSDDMRVPVTWGTRRPVVLLPAEAASWPAERLDAVLLHELAHVRRWDYATHVACEAVRAVYWPNPLAWLACRHARIERERACDDAVLRFGTASTEYARLLLDLARGLTGSSVLRGAMAAARPSMLRERINGVLDGALDRRPAARVRVALAVVLLLGVVGASGTLRVWESPPRTDADWIATLDHGDPEMRRAAVRTLEMRATDEAIAGLAHAMTSDDEVVRRMSVQALGRVADPRVVPALVDVVTGGHGDLYQKRLAATVLRSLDTRAARRAREGQLLDRGPTSRTVRDRTGTADPVVWRSLVRVLLEHDDPETRARAAAALVEVGCETAVPELVLAAEDESPTVRLAVARALGSFETWPARRALARLAEDTDRDVRRVAEGALDCDTNPLGS